MISDGHDTVLELARPGGLGGRCPLDVQSEQGKTGESERARQGGFGREME
jgi:hypothetical protein